jgi:hypothetical protein
LVALSVPAGFTIQPRSGVEVIVVDDARRLTGDGHRHRVGVAGRAVLDGELEGVAARQQRVEARHRLAVAGEAHLRTCGLRPDVAEGGWAVAVSREPRPSRVTRADVAAATSPPADASGGALSLLTSPVTTSAKGWGPWGTVKARTVTV